MDDDFNIFSLIFGIILIILWIALVGCIAFFLIELCFGALTCGGIVGFFIGIFKGIYNYFASLFTSVKFKECE